MFTSTRSSRALRFTTSRRMAMVEMESALTTARPLVYCTDSSVSVKTLTKNSVRSASWARGGTSGSAAPTQSCIMLIVNLPCRRRKERRNQNE